MIMNLGSSRLSLGMSTALGLALACFWAGPLAASDTEKPVMARPIKSDKPASGLNHQALEARLMDLETRLSALQKALNQALSDNEALKAATRDSFNQGQRLASAVETIQKAPPSPTSVSDGFKTIGGAHLKMGGFVKLAVNASRWSDGDVAANALGRDFYLPQQIPVGGARESLDNDFSIKQTRLWFQMETPVAGHSLKAYVETDFQTAAGTQGSERTTNGYNLAVRRAYMQYDKWTMGQDWTTFQNVGVLPESTDFIGPTEGTVFVRQPLIRYSALLDNKTTLHMALENAETATSNVGAPALIENDDDSLPDFVVRLNCTHRLGDWSVAALARQLQVDNGAINAQKSGFGLSVAGKTYFDDTKKIEARFMLTSGSGIGRYVGLNLAPDAIYVASTSSLETIRTTAGFAALRLNLSPKSRTNLVYSFQSLDHDKVVSSVSMSGFTKEASSLSLNWFTTPTKGLDLGWELRRAKRETFGGVDGHLDRAEFIAKYSF